MAEALLVVIALLLVANLLLSAFLLRRPGNSEVLLRLQNADRNLERTESIVREELGRNRQENSANAQQLREELDKKLTDFAGGTQTKLTDMAGLLQKQLDSFNQQLRALSEGNLKKFDQVRETIEARLELLRTTVDGKLRQIQDDNSKKLEQMRATVEEKLQGTLEKRLGESFKLVSDRLELVHKGLGEMQNLAVGVGDLKRVLSNVKTRGGWGEVQLGMLLEQILSPDQYEKNVRTKENTRESVEFALKLPGRGDDNQVVWVPIDAKFPIEDYQRLVEAQEQVDLEAVEEAGKNLARRIKACAKDICEKYINPPKTTDFALMFLPTEGLYAEVVRRVGLVEEVQRECRVVMAGPSTLVALLNSLQMGFRTLAIQQRSSEVWNLLGAVKSEFGKFGDLLEGVKKKLSSAADTIDDAAKKSRTIERKLKSVQELPSTEARSLLGNGGDSEELF